MALPLIPLLGPLLIKGAMKFLPGRFAEAWAPRIGKLLALALVGVVIWFAISRGVDAIRDDARNDLLAEQAAERAAADAAQRERERRADDRRRAELNAGHAADSAQQKEITDATKGLPDTRPTARQRARVCVELQRQDKAAGRSPRSC